MTRTIGLTAAAMLAASGAVAEDAALLIANGRYADGDRVRGAGDVVTAAGALTEAGISTLAETDADRQKILALLRDFAGIVSEADGLVVALSGQFVHSDRETWFLPTDSDGTDLVDTGMRAVPLSLIGTMLGATSERALLALSPLVDEVETGPGLTQGIGPLDLPDGVTVIRGDAAAVAEVLRGTVAEPGASLTDRIAGTDALSGGGYLPEDYAFLPPDRGGSAEESAAALYWRLVEGRDTAEAYRDYLDRFPESDLAVRAERRLAEMEDDPGGRASAAERALGLSRQDRRDIQADLSVLGYDTRGIDGLFGPGTRGAIAAWQGDNGEPETSYLGRNQITAIERQAGMRRDALEGQERGRRETALREERAYWQQTGAGETAEGIVAFLSRHPDGEYAAEAESRLRTMRGEDRPISAAEQKSWDVARERGRPGAYRAYIDAYPKGRYVEESRRALGELQERSQSDAEIADARRSEAELGLTAFTRRAIEERLEALDLHPGRVDGNFDAATRRSIRRYQRSAGLSVTGHMNQLTTVRLLADGLRTAVDD